MQRHLCHDVKRTCSRGPSDRSGLPRLLSPRSVHALLHGDEGLELLEAAVEVALVDRAGDARDLPTLRVLPEVPALPTLGQLGLGLLGVGGEPERVVDEVGMVAEALLPGPEKLGVRALPTSGRRRSCGSSSRLGLGDSSARRRQLERAGDAVPKTIRFSACAV
jgi:hypothetical protein